MSSFERRFCHLKAKGKSICTNLLPTLLLTGAMGVSLVAGILTNGKFAVLVYVYPILYFVFYFVTNANRLSFPMYFFISMMFMLGNAGGQTVEDLPFVITFQSCVVVIALIVCLVLSVRWHLPWKPEEGAMNFIKSKYRNMLASDPDMTLRITLHCLILYIAGFTGYLLQDYRGKWVLLSCGCVLIGDQLKILTRRGCNFAVGLSIGCLIAGCIGALHVPVSVRVWFYIPLFIGVFFFMPKVIRRPQFYIGGSALVAVMVITGDSLSQEILTRDIVAERFLCGLLGLAIALVCTHLINLVNKNVYDPDMLPGMPAKCLSAGMPPENGAGDGAQAASAASAGTKAQEPSAG